MKITRAKLKQIITEEVNRMEEVKNDRVELATMQSQMDKINGSEDGTLIIQIGGMCDQMIDPISRLTDGSMQGALANQLQVFQQLVADISNDFGERNRNRESQMPAQHMGGVQFINDEGEGT